MSEVGTLLPLVRKLFSERFLLRDEDGGDGIFLTGTKLCGVPEQRNGVLNSTALNDLDGLCVLAYSAISTATELHIPRKKGKVILVENKSTKPTMEVYAAFINCLLSHPLFNPHSYLLLARSSNYPNSKGTITLEAS